MLLTKSEKKENRVEFTVQSDAKEFDEAVHKIYLQEKGKIAIPGFRKGKAPLAIIEGMYGPDVFYQGALEELAQDAFQAGMDQGNIKMIGQPAIVLYDVTPDRCALYTFSVEAYPEVELGEYKGLEVTKPDVKVSKAEVDEYIENKRKQNGRTITVEDRPAKLGDTCNIDFDGFLDKEKTDRFDGGKGEGYDLELGSNSFVPGFEDQIVGMNIGEEKDINITFPEEYVEDLAGKDVVFAVKLNEIKETELPALDDEFAKDVSEFDTLKEYKDSVKKELLEQKEAQAKVALRNEAIIKACDNMKAEVPETMVKAHIDAIIRNFAANYGVNDPEIATETLASMMGMDEETMNTAVRPSAVNEARTELLVNAIIEKEGIDPTEEELDEYIAKVAETSGATADQMKQYFGVEYIRDQYMKDKALELVADSAVVKAPAKKSTKKATAEEPKAEESVPAVDAAEEKSAKKPAAKKPAAKKTTKKAEEEKKED